MDVLGIDHVMRCMVRRVGEATVIYIGGRNGRRRKYQDRKMDPRRCVGMVLRRIGTGIIARRLEQRKQFISNGREG